MPTVLRIGGFSFAFYSNDHDPPHVHVTYGGAECRVSLATLAVKNSTMKAADRSRAVRLVATHREALHQAWAEFQLRKAEL